MGVNAESPAGFGKMFWSTAACCSDQVYPASTEKPRAAIDYAEASPPAVAELTEAASDMLRAVPPQVNFRSYPAGRDVYGIKTLSSHHEFRTKEGNANTFLTQRKVEWERKGLQPSGRDAREK